MWGLSIVSWDLIALLFGVAAVVALYFSATNANRQTEKLRQTTAQLHRETASLSADAEASRAQIAAAQARAAEANQKAAEAALALAKFKAARSLTPDQQAQIAAVLKPFAGTVFDGGIGPEGDPEPLFLFRSIHDALVSAGWSPADWSGAGATLTETGLPKIGLTMVTNVIIDVHPSRWAKYGAAAEALAGALNAAGVDAIADSKPTSIDSDAVHVRIGRKM
jgi:hypothetical protein